MKREPITTSYSSFKASSFGISDAGCCPSPSTWKAKSNPFSNAYRKPVCTAPPMPKLTGKSNVTQFNFEMISEVESVEQSLTTTTVIDKFCTAARELIPFTTAVIAFSSLKAGTMVAILVIDLKVKNLKVNAQDSSHRSSLQRRKSDHCR